MKIEGKHFTMYHDYYDLPEDELIRRIREIGFDDVIEKIHDAIIYN